MSLLEKNWKLFLFVVFPAFSLFAHSYMLDNELLGVHAWRQCETASNVANFANVNSDILSPRVFSLEWIGGLKRMEFPLMQWIFAWFWRIFGESIWSLRMMSWLIGFFASIAIFKISEQLFKSRLVALLAAWCWMHSPLIFYYSINPLPDNFALMAALWGMYFFVKAYRDQKWISFFISSCFLALSTATKLPFVFFFSLPWAYELARLFHSRGKSILSGLGRVLPSFLILTLPLAWYAWVIPTWSGNGVVKGVLTTKMDEIPELLRILLQNIISILPELLLNYASVLFFILGIFTIFKGRYYKHILAFPFSMLAFSAVSYFIFEINMITDVHDYYLFPFMPGIFIFVGFGLNYILSERKGVFVLLMAIALVVLPITASLRVAPRFNTNNSSKHLAKCSVEIQNVLPKDAIIISADDESPHITLFHFRRFGWTTSKSRFDEAKFEFWLKGGATHFVSRDRELEKFPQIAPHLGTQEFQCEEYIVWNLK